MIRATANPRTSSLVGRLVLAQMGLVGLLWLGALAYLVNDTARYDEIFEPRLAGPRADMILSVVDALIDEPQKLNATLTLIDAFQRRENHEEDDPALRQSMVVWKGDKLLFVSPGEPGVVRTTKQRQLERVTVSGIPWRTYTQNSQHSDARVTLIRSGHVMSIILALGGRGILILPLLISLPFLVFPAWWSVRVALRPWRRFSEEIASRGPEDFSPLRFGSRYRELRPVSQAVNELLLRVQRGVARERSFIADAAHELRTPLAAMRVNVEALQRHPAQGQAGELLAGLVRSLERSSRLVAQLLGLMRSDADSLPENREDIHLSGLVQDRLALLSVAARPRQVELDLTRAEDGLVRGEREGLISLIDNLVENAIKYSPTGSVVMVSVRRQEAGLELCVQDHGCGIAEELRERVFTRFFRAPDQTQPGSGLGLAIVKAVADRHGAQISLSSAAAASGLRVIVLFAQQA